MKSSPPQLVGENQLEWEAECGSVHCLSTSEEKAQRCWEAQRKSQLLV